MMTNDGRTTPNVAQNEPKTPPVSAPTYVAMLTANGPGVLSLTATKLTREALSSQLCAATSSWISGSMA